MDGRRSGTIKSRQKSELVERHVGETDRGGSWSSSRGGSETKARAKRGLCSG